VHDLSLGVAELLDLAKPQRPLIGELPAAGNLGHRSDHAVWQRERRKRHQDRASGATLKVAAQNVSRSDGIEMLDEAL